MRSGIDNSYSKQDVWLLQLCIVCIAIGYIRICQNLECVTVYIYAHFSSFQCEFGHSLVTSGLVNSDFQSLSKGTMQARSNCMLWSCEICPKI